MTRPPFLSAFASLYALISLAATIAIIAPTPVFSFDLPPLPSYTPTSNNVEGVVYREISRPADTASDSAKGYLFTVLKENSGVDDSILAAKIANPLGQRFPFKFSLSFSKNGVSLPTSTRISLPAAERRELADTDLLVQLRVCDSTLNTPEEVRICSKQKPDSEGVSKVLSGMKLEGIADELTKGLRTSVALRVH